MQSFIFTDHCPLYSFIILSSHQQCFSGYEDTTDRNSFPSPSTCFLVFVGGNILKYLIVTCLQTILIWGTYKSLLDDVFKKANSVAKELGTKIAAFIVEKENAVPKLRTEFLEKPSIVNAYLPFVN